MRTTRLRLRLTGILSVVALSSLFLTVTSPAANAAEPSVGLGNADSYVVLAGTTVTNTGPSVISGDLGVSPGTAVTGFGPGLVNNGSIHQADAHAAAAQAALITAYDSAAGRANNVTVTADLGGQTLAGGVYTSASSMFLTGTVTLNADWQDDAVWIFRAASTLITAPASTVLLINGANPCNVFWQVGSSTTLDTTTTFAGTILALTSITANTGATVEGRLLARNGAVTLDTNVITTPDCTSRVTTTSSTPDTTPTTVEDTTTTVGTGGVTTTTALEETTTTVATGGVTTTIAPEEATTTTVATGGVTTTTAETTTTVGLTAAPDVTTTTVATGTPLVPGLPSTPATPGRPATPFTPATPGAPGTPGTPATPGTPDLPRTGHNLAPVAGLGALALVVGAVLVRRSRRSDDSTPPTLAW